MVLPCSPCRPHHDKPETRRRRPTLLPMLYSRDARDMVSLLVSAVAGALTTGALATLIMMSPPAYAGTAGTDDAESAAHMRDTSQRLYPARAVPGDDPAPVPFSSPRGLELPPVCTCVLPQAMPN